MSVFDHLHSVSKKDIKRVSKILADAFSEDPIWSELIKDLGNNFDTSIIYQIPIKYCLRYGKVFATSGNLEGIMAFTTQNRANMKASTIIRSGAILSSLKLGMKFGKKMLRIFEIIEDDRKNLDIGPFYYINIIGVAPEFQGQGFGGKLLRVLIEKSKEEGKSIYLETETEENVKFYEKFGFKLLKVITLPELNIPMWEMVRYNN